MRGLEAVKVLREFVAEERRMREWVFRNDMGQRKKKLAACDRAEEAIASLAQLAHIGEKSGEQLKLYPEEEG